MSRNSFWLSVEQWERIEPYLPIDVRGKEQADDRRVISASELRTRARRELYSCQRVRLLAIADARDGKEVEAVAGTINVQPETMYCWFRQGAVDGLDSDLKKSKPSLNQNSPP
jgi:hypothetical protein